MAFGTLEQGIVYANLGLQGLALSATAYSSALSSGTSVRDYANGLVSSSQSALSSTAYSTAVMANLGLTEAVIGKAAYDALLPALAAYVDAVGVANRGVVTVQLAQIVAGLTTDATYGKAATNLSNASASAYAYSSNAANTTSKAINVTTEPAPVSNFSLSTAATDILVGTAGNDVFTGVATTYDDTDRVVDSNTTDADVLNLSESAAVNPDVTNVETLNITLSALGALAVDASKLTGAKTLTVTRGDVTVGGSTLTGDKAVSVTNVDASGIAKIIAGAGSASLNIDAAATDKAGLVVDADVVTGNVTVDGAATISAAASTGTVAIDAVSNTTAAETAKASSITANLATTVTTHADLTGSVTINAAKASTITVNDAQGGATVNGATTSTADSTITVVDVDASGATITTGTGSATAADKQITINVDGTALTTDAVSISAGGVIALDLDGTTAQTVDLVTLSGNGAAVTYNLGANAGTAVSYTKAGADSVTLAGDESNFSAVTVTGFDVLNLDAGTAGTIDASKWTALGKVKLGFDNAGQKITVSEGLKIEINIAQANTDFDYATGAKNMTIIAGDVNGAANTAVGTLTTGTLDAAAGGTAVGTVTIVAEEANMTVTTGTVVGALQTIVIQGDEDVNLAAVTAKAVDASASTGIITLTATTNLSDTVQTGSGADVLTANGADVHTFASGAGNDTITITDTEDTSVFDSGDGNDTVHMNKAGKAYVVVAGAGDDTLNTAIDLEAIVVGGDGSDTLKIGAATLDLADNTYFAFSGIEKLDLTSATGATVISAKQLSNNRTLAIVADGDQLSVEIDPAVAAKGGTLDASGITIATGSTAVLNYVGSSKTDTITGGVEAELFTMTAGDDTIDGGTGTGKSDKFTAAAVADTGTAVSVVINLSGTAVSATDILAKTGYRTAGDNNAGAGTAQSLFNDTVATNDAAVTSLANIESVVGTSGKDYIVAAATATVIEGGAEADYIKLGAGSDTVVFTTTATADTISGFQIGAGGDILNVQGLDADINDTLKVATLSSGGGTLTSIGGSATAADVDVIILLNTTGFANTGAINTELNATAGAITDTDGAIVVAYNSTTSKVEVYHVTDESVGAGTLALVGTLDGLTAANLASLAAANFA